MFTIQIMILMKKIVSLAVLFLSMFNIDADAQYFNPYSNPYVTSYQVGQQISQQLTNAIDQSAKYGRNRLCKSIDKWGECANGTLSLEYGAVAIYGKNGYFCTGTVDDRLSSKLKAINKSGGDVVDVNIAENGKFIIVYNKGVDWYGVLPSELSAALDTYSYGTKFRSVTFNEKGVYAITTSNGFKSNNKEYQAFYDDNKQAFGELLSVTVCGDGAVFCYSDKTRYCGKIPSTVESAMNRFSYTANYVKFNRQGDYLICSKAGSFSYSIAPANAGRTVTMVSYDYMKDREERIRKQKEQEAARRRKVADEQMNIGDFESAFLYYKSLYEESGQKRDFEPMLKYLKDKEDHTNTLKYYKKVYELTLDNGMADEIAEMYFNLNKYDDAVEWYSIRARKGNKESQYQLGKAYEKKNDKNMAIFWYRKSAEQKCMKAEEALAHYGVYLTDSSKGSQSDKAADGHSHYSPEYGFRDVWVQCAICHGSGECWSCHGQGWCISTRSDGSYNSTYKCPICSGMGNCTTCFGTGGHYEKQQYQIR